MLGANKPFPVSIIATVTEAVQPVSKLSTNCMSPNKSELLILNHFKFILLLYLFICLLRGQDVLACDSDSTGFFLAPG